MRWHCPPDTGNSSTGGLRPRTLPLSHGGSPQYCVLHVDGEETFLFLSSRRDRVPNSGVKGSGANHYPIGPCLHRYLLSLFLLTCEDCTTIIIVRHVAILNFRLWQLFTVHEWLQFLEDTLFEFDEHIVVIVSIKIIPKSGIFSIANMNLCLCGQKITKCITMLLLHRYKPIQTNSCSSYLLTL